MEVEEEPLDPRVGAELERLNRCTEAINGFELELEDASSLFRTLLTDSTHQLKALSKQLGPCIERARPFYEAQETLLKAQAECQSAATHYQRASGIHLAAKETVALAEQRFIDSNGQWEFDNAWQEMLNHATIKVMEAEKQKTESETEHEAKALAFRLAEDDVQKLEKKLGKFVSRSKAYFERKDAFNKALEAQKKRVEDLQCKVTSSKADYAAGLRNLEAISESIHAKRKLKGLRLPGVGAEETDKGLVKLPSFDLDTCDVVSTSSMASTDVTSVTSMASTTSNETEETRRCPGSGMSSQSSIEDISTKLKEL